MTTGGVCWVLTPGEAGMRSQALGLAEAVGLPVVEKRAFVRPALAWLPGGLLPMPLSALDPAGDPIAPPWPGLVVSCGRRSIGPALAIKRLSFGQTLAVYVQNPEFARRKFDLVAAMPHDGIVGANVITVDTALHSVTQERLTRARAEWRDRLVKDGRPLLGVLVGGDSGNYRLTAAVTSRLLDLLRRAHAERGSWAAVTPSRRTGEGARRTIADVLRSEDLGTLWDETGPYLGILALSDRLIVTGESISMISEALSSGRPVHVFPLEGQGRRHNAFLTRIADARLVSLVEGDDLDWSFAGPGPIDATSTVARRIREMLEMRSAR